MDIHSRPRIVPPATDQVSIDFWPGCGFRGLTRAADGQLAVSDDYLRWYLERPELAPVAESCAAERALYEALCADPRRPVSGAELAALADADARDNYQILLRFRERLLEAGTLERFYSALFQSDVAIPPQFVHYTVEVILRGLLDGERDGLCLRAAEIFFREQRVTVNEGAVMLADAETVGSHAEDGGLGNLGRMLLQVNAPLKSAELDVLDRENHEEYFRRDGRRDTVLQINPGTPGSLAIARVIECWVLHFHGLRTRVTPIREIDDEEWLWHVGLDVEATALLNDIYAGAEVDEARMKRVIGLFRMDFDDAGALRPELAGAPVFLALMMTPEGRLRMKPQNLLTNLPLASRT